MTDLSLLRPCCLLNLLLRDEITRAAAPNAPKYVRHVVWGSSFVCFFFFSFYSCSYDNEGNDSGPLGKFDAEHAGTGRKRDRFLCTVSITTVKKGAPGSH